MTTARRILRRKAKPKTVTRKRVAAPKIVKRSRSAKSLDLGAELSQRLFAAAFGEQAEGAFEQACVREIQTVTGAADVVILLASAPNAASCAFGTSSTAVETAKALLSDNGTGTKKRRAKKAPAVNASLVQIASHDGERLGDLYCTFRQRKQKPSDRKKRLAAAMPGLAAALTARRAAGAVIAPHQFNSLATTIPGVVYQRIVRMDGDIRYTYLSDGAREMFGVEPKAVLADPEVLFRTYTEDYRQTFRARLVEASKSLTKWDVEATIDLPDGRKRTTHAIARPEPLPDGSVLWTGVILDATRTKEAEDKLKSANRMVGLANQAKSAFLAKMSHEMRTPLNGVLGMADLLLKTEMSPRQTRLANTLCDSAKNLLGIINDVLDLSRIEAGQFKIDPLDFNLRHCIEDALELCSTAAYRKGLEINLVIAPGTPIGVKSDPVRLRQVLINLIGNSIKFTETGEVMVRLRPICMAGGADAVVFEVIDTGIGINKEAIARLFEPFAQADQTISRRFGGTGLGLSITRHLVQALGGTIEMESTKGKGTTVRFTIPFNVNLTSPALTIIDKVSLVGMRALIVDDRPTTREMLASNLDELGMRAVQANSETEALSMMTDAVNSGMPYDVIIVDRVRPRMSGLHLCRTLRANPKLSNVPAIALMSANWNANPIDQHGLGRTAILSKPVRRTDLLSALARLRNPSFEVDVAAAQMRDGKKSSKLQAAQLKLRVLLVEDNLTNIEVAREYLNELDCRVTVAMNGIEGIAAYDRANFDIILMDSQMPELDGLSATRRIRASEQSNGRTRTPIVSVTANAYESDRLQALEAGADDFLSKPFTDIQLRDMLLRWGKTAKPEEAEVPAPSAATPLEPVKVAIIAAAPPPVIGDAAHLDVELHEVLLKSRPAFLKRLVRAYLAAVPDTLIALREAVAQSNAEVLRAAAHSLKSSSANIGARKLSEQCRAMEMKLRLGSDVGDCEGMAAEVALELGHTEKALERLLSRIPDIENGFVVNA